MPAAIVTVMYPKTETSTFDMNYYMKTHMPLVQEKWGPHGLQNWTIYELDGKDGWSVQALLYWDSMESFAKAAEAEAEKIMADVPNFSSEKPLLVKGTEVPRHSK
ncbi:Ethyl tert-butyl ether degradation protein [Rutstroemia sp. NJR-2017a WRK4]|nr:Ethyl tert-butyl ether degradation protein [Rutstroemia sp. NJR-2017a WRK4]PQE11876.1 Ethyl tert-butyl ether degradation protein [Rutstroemia sp. NJR-2017a WRK4]